MTDAGRHDRRSFLRLAAASLTGVVVSGCGSDPQGEEPGPADPARGRPGQDAGSRKILRASVLPPATRGAHDADYAATRSPDAADLSMAAMTSWRRTAAAKSGTVRDPVSRSAANAA